MFQLKFSSFARFTTEEIMQILFFSATIEIYLFTYIFKDTVCKKEKAYLSYLFMFF